LCAALVSGRDLLTRLDRDDAKTQAAREMFEDSDESDFITLMRAYDFAKSNRFSFDRCRSHGINAQVARQVEQTCQQILHAAHQQRLYDRDDRAATPANPAKNDDALRRCLMAGFVDQLAKRREPGKTACDLTEQRQGQLVRESVVQDAPYFVAANMHQVPSRGSLPLTLLSLATAVKPEWITEMFPQHLSTTLEHLFDGKNKRVAVKKLVRYHDLVIEQKSQQRDLDPVASGRCLAEARRSGAFELPLMDHRLKQFIARVSLVHATLPELEFVPFDDDAITTSLARAFRGLSRVKEAQAAPLIGAFHRHLEKGQISWLDELLPLSIPWVDKRTTKVSYLNGSPEAQVKLKECWGLEEHPSLCEGRLPVLLKLCTPDGKRLATTTDWPHFLAREWPKHRPTVARKFPGHVWR
jgi:ATP-dependent helicase HrpB